MKKLLKLLSITALLGLIAGAGVGAGMYFDLIDTPESIAKLGSDDDDSASEEKPDVVESPSEDAKDADVTEGPDAK